MPRRSVRVRNEPDIKRILVRCSRTAKLILTGQTVKESEFESMRLTNNKLTCIHCGEVHRWSRENVVLARLSS